jgi:prepilin-type N-terminal cleavage/methylation domain-containing protein
MSATEPPLGPSPARRAQARQRGVSMIELMVGLVVSLIVGIAASSSAVMFTASQRQGMGVGGVAVNVNTALAALKNDAATAGLGFFGDSRFLCSALNLGMGATAALGRRHLLAGAHHAHVGIDRVDVLQASRVESVPTCCWRCPAPGPRQPEVLPAGQRWATRCCCRPTPWARPAPCARSPR